MLLPKSKSKIVVYTYTNSQCTKITKNIFLFIEKYKEFIVGKSRTALMDFPQKCNKFKKMFTIDCESVLCTENDFDIIKSQCISMAD